MYAMQAQAKRRLLAPLYRRSPKLFDLWLHLFAAKRILGAKTHAVHHMSHEGQMPKEDAELVLPVLEAFTGQWVGYLDEPYDYYFPTEKAVTGGKGSLKETVEAMRKLRKE